MNWWSFAIGVVAGGALVAVVKWMLGPTIVFSGEWSDGRRHVYTDAEMQEMKAQYRAEHQEGAK
jgi:predicted RND superfamily exporter protein